MALQEEELRIALLTALASAYESGSLQRILKEVLESPKAAGRPRDEAIRAAGIGVDDLLADFDSPRDPSSDAAEVSFDLSTSPSNEESGGFFISTGGGGLNLPLDDDDDAFKERCPDAADDEDLTEETRRVYLSKGEDGRRAEAAPAASASHVATALEDSLEISELSASLEPPIAPPEEGDSNAASGVFTETIRLEVKTSQDQHEEMLIRLHDRLLAKQSVMQCVLKGLLNVQAREMRTLKASLEEPKTARVEEVAPEGVHEQAAEPGRRHGRGSKSLAGAKKRRTVTSNVRSTTTSSVSAGAKVSTRASMPASPRPEGASSKRRSSKVIERQPQSPTEGAENSSRPSSHSSRRSDREEEPEREATDPEAALGPTEGQEGQEAAETGQDTLVDDQGIGVCEVSEAEFQLLFDAGVLYQAYGFYPQQPVGFSFIPSFGEQIPAEAVTADPQPRVEEWYQPNPVPVNPATAPVQGISPMLGAMDPMYQQYQYQTAPQIPQMQPMQQGFSPQYQYPYYQQGQYAQYAGAAQPYGAQQLYQHQMQQAANRPPSQQAQAPASGAAGRRQNASKDSDSAPGSPEASDAEAEGDKEAESPKDGAKNAKKPKGKAAAKTKVRKKPIEKPPVDKGPKCQLFFLPLDTLQHWKKDPDGQKDEHSHHEEHGEMSDEISHASSDEDWPAMGHHWSEAHVPSEYEEHRADAHEEEPMESPPGDVVAGSALNSARALKSARTMPERTADQPQSTPIRPPQSKPKTRRPQPNVVFAGDGH